MIGLERHHLGLVRARRRRDDASKQGEAIKRRISKAAPRSEQDQESQAIMQRGRRRSRDEETHT